MSRLSRRELLLGAVASGALISAPAKAQQQRPVRRIIRRDLSTVEGRQDLAKLARAVGLMGQLPGSDPRSWIFQWYIHSVPSSTTKQVELARLYPQQSATRRLAAEIWSTCQAHHVGSEPEDFLPWHRMYLRCFERTVQSVLNDPTFALPYWNYTDPGQRALPSEFLQSSDPLYGALHRPDRRGAVNQGAPIDDGLPVPSPVNADALSMPSYGPSGALLGFCSHIDGNLHGTIHVRVGNGRGMGSVPWAANDPIFWVHHANIDRLWASWNNNGGRNPGEAGWLQRSYVFADGLGGRAELKNEAATNFDSQGYQYDRLEPGPTIVAATAGQRPVIVVGRTTQPLAVDPEGAETTLRPEPQPPGVAAVAGRRIYLIVSGLEADVEPGVLYEVQVQSRRRDWVTVGHINFFDAVTYHSQGEHGAARSPARRFSFDVTSLVAGVRRLPPVRVRPVGAPEGGITVRIGALELVSN